MSNKNLVKQGPRDDFPRSAHPFKSNRESQIRNVPDHRLTPGYEREFAECQGQLRQRAIAMRELLREKASGDPHFEDAILIAAEICTIADLAREYGVHRATILRRYRKTKRLIEGNW